MYGVEQKKLGEEEEVVTTAPRTEERTGSKVKSHLREDLADLDETHSVTERMQSGETRTAPDTNTVTEIMAEGHQDCILKDLRNDQE